LTTAVGALAKDKSLGRAEALRRAMLSVMADTSKRSDYIEHLIDRGISR